MSKQGYQQIGDVPNGQEYGFASRLPQASSGSCQADGACHANFNDGEGYRRAEASTSGGGVAQMAYPSAYNPSLGYEAPVAGYPVITTPMAAPVGMVAQDPLGRRGRRRARRMGGNGWADGGQRRRVGPVSALIGLVRSAMQSRQEHQNIPEPRPGSYQ